MRSEKVLVAEETAVGRIAVIRRVRPLRRRMPRLAVDVTMSMLETLFSDREYGDEVVAELCRIEGRRKCIDLDEVQPIGFSMHRPMREAEITFKIAFPGISTSSGGKENASSPIL